MLLTYSFTTGHLLNSMAIDEKNEHVQQADVFKRQTLVFQVFQRRNSFKLQLQRCEIYMRPKANILLT